MMPSFSTNSGTCGSRYKTMTVAQRWALLFAVIACITVAPSANAADWPVRPIRFVVPSAPGGGTDITARIVGQKLSEIFKASVVVENKPGADELIGAAFVAKSAADGYTFLVTSAGAAVNPSMYRKMPYDAQRDLKPVVMLAQLPYVLIVNPKLPVKSIEEFVDYSIKRPNGLNFAVGGTSNLLVSESLRLNTNAHIVMIRYKGCGPATTSVMTGETDAAFCSTSSVAAQATAGTVRALAVTGNSRGTNLPGIPTSKELGIAKYQIDLVQWLGIFAPGDTPTDITTRLNEEVNNVLRMPDVIETLSQNGAIPGSMTMGEFTELFKNEMATYAKIVSDANITLSN